MSNTNTAELLKIAIARLPRHTHLYDVGRSDKLTDKQCAAILDGNLESVEGEFFENMSSDDSIDFYLGEAIKDSDDREEFVASDDFHLFQDECFNRDKSNPWETLVKNTGKRMVRFSIPSSTNPLDGINMEGDSYSWTEEQTMAEVHRLLDELRFEKSESNMSNMREIVENASYGGELVALAYVDFSCMIDIVQHVMNYSTRTAKVTLSGKIHLVMYDGWNGSGYSADLDGKVEVTIDRSTLNRLRLDHSNSGHGYSWSDDIAGIIYDGVSRRTMIRIEYLHKEANGPFEVFAMDGGTCGIRTVDGTLVVEGLPSFEWASQVAALPSLPVSPEAEDKSKTSGVATTNDIA